MIENSVIDGNSVLSVSQDSIKIHCLEIHCGHFITVNLPSVNSLYGKFIASKSIAL